MATSSTGPVSHRGFNILDGFGNVSGQINGTIGGNENVILNSDSHLFFREVDARLNGDDGTLRDD